MNVPVVENLNFIYKQNFLSKINYFFWDKINLNTNNLTEYDITVTYNRERNPDNSYSYEYLFNGSNNSLELVKGNTSRFLLNIQNYDREVNNGFKIVSTSNPDDLNWSLVNGTPENKTKYLVTTGISHSDGTTKEDANSGKNFGVLTYKVPLNINIDSHFIVGPWRYKSIDTNNILINRIAYTEKLTIDVFYDIYLNDTFLKRSLDNFFYLDPGVGCEKKCVKIKTVFHIKNTNTFFFSEFSKEVCFISPPDRYCNLKINLSQNIKIKEKDKQKFKQKLQMLENKNKSSRMKYANAIKNKASASSLNMTNTIRSMYYKECE